MDAFRYLAAAIAAALNGAYEDAGRIFSYAIKESDAQSLMKKLAEFAVSQNVSSTAQVGVQYEEAQALLHRILGSTPVAGVDGSYLPPGFDPAKGDPIGFSEAAGPGVGQETTQDVPQERLYDTNPPIPRDQLFGSLDTAVTRLDTGEKQRRAQESADADASEKDAKGLFTDRLVDAADASNDQVDEETSMSGIGNRSTRRKGDRLARSVFVALSQAQSEYCVDVLSTSEVSISDGEDRQVMNHDANTDRSDWVDENDIITSPNPTKVRNHAAEDLDSSSDELEEEDSEDPVISEEATNKIPVIAVSADRSKILAYSPEEAPNAGLIPVDDDVSDDPSEDDVPLPDDDLEGVPAIPASFSHVLTTNSRS